MAMVLPGFIVGISNTIGDRFVWWSSIFHFLGLSLLVTYLMIFLGYDVNHEHLKLMKYMETIIESLIGGKC